ncbi:hypothetical protein ACYB2S_12580 [Corynebacterium variabile]|uniref:hypothetical protein n=1 Tax=Corynebacterium variabile TaxID=1727 RepID=UPI003C8E2C19
MTETITFGEVIARNARRLRGAHTMDEVATAARSLGVNWSSGNVSAIEKGKGRATLQNLLILTHALGKVNGRAIGPSELLESLPAWIDVGFGRNMTSSPSLAVWWKEGRDPLLPITPSGTRVVAMATSESADRQSDRQRGDLVQHPSARVTTTDERLARSMNLDSALFRACSELLWKRGFEDERDDRAGEGATAQKKGRVSRTMKGELIAFMRELVNEEDERDDPR